MIVGGELLKINATKQSRVLLFGLTGHQETNWRLLKFIFPMIGNKRHEAKRKKL